MLAGASPFRDSPDKQTAWRPVQTSHSGRFCGKVENAINAKFSQKLAPFRFVLGTRSSSEEGRRGSLKDFVQVDVVRRV
jgi:hypothetical protein